MQVESRHSQNTLTATLLRLTDYVRSVFTPGWHTQGLSGPLLAPLSGEMSECSLNTELRWCKPARPESIKGVKTYLEERADGVNLKSLRKEKKLWNDSTTAADVSPAG